MAACAEGLLAAVRGSTFRALCAATAQDADGLAVVARRARRLGLITPRTAKKLVRIDEAFCLVRHLSGPRVASFDAELRAELSAHRSAPQEGSEEKVTGCADLDFQRMPKKNIGNTGPLALCDSANSTENTNADEQLSTSASGSTHSDSTSEAQFENVLEQNVEQMLSTSFSGTSLEGTSEKKPVQQGGKKYIQSSAQFTKLGETLEAAVLGGEQSLSNAEKESDHFHDCLDYAQCQNAVRGLALQAPQYKKRWPRVTNLIDFRECNVPHDHWRDTLKTMGLSDKEADTMGVSLEFSLHHLD